MYGKSPTILARSDTAKILTKHGIRKLTPLECERLQCLPDNYTDCLSNTQRYKAIGNGFTVDAILHILLNISKDFNEAYLLKYIDLFCGIGGFRVGIESVMQGNADCVFSSDFNKSVCDSYSLNFNEYPFSDITQVNEKEIPNHDLLCAGFPCQPLVSEVSEKVLRTLEVLYFMTF